jgi:hypothetical protein
MPTKKKPVTLTYKIGARYILTKAPKSLSFLVNQTLTVEAANSKDIKFGGRGLLVVSRDEIRKKAFRFQAAPADQPVLDNVRLRPYDYLEHRGTANPSKLETDPESDEEKLARITNMITSFEGGDMTQIIEEIKKAKCIMKVWELFTIDQLKTLIYPFPQLFVTIASKVRIIFDEDKELREKAFELYCVWETQSDIREIVRQKFRRQYPE